MKTPGTLLDLYLLASPCHSDRWKANGRSIHGQKQISMVKNSRLIQLSLLLHVCFTLVKTIQM